MGIVFRVVIVLTVYYAPNPSMTSSQYVSYVTLRYKVLTFWLDRDTDDVTGGRSFHDFLAWAEVV